MKKVLIAIALAMLFSLVFSLVAVAAAVTATDNNAQTLASRGISVTWDTVRSGMSLGISYQEYGSCVITHDTATDSYTIAYSAKWKNKYSIYETYATLAADQDITFTLVVKDASGNVINEQEGYEWSSGDSLKLPSVTATSGTPTYYYAYITNISLKSSALDITVNEGKGAGAFKIGDNNVVYGEQYSTDANGWLSYEATPGSNYTFWGFYQTDATGANGVFKAAPGGSGKIQFTEACTIRPLFVVSDSAMFSVGGAMYPYLDAALGVANSGTNKTVNVASSGSAYPFGSTSAFTVPSGVTLLVPRADGDDGSGVQEKNDGLRGDVYRYLILPSGATLDVNGTLIVNAVQGSANGVPYQGKIVGTYGELRLNETSSIKIYNGGVLYARGLVTGSGSIQAQNGAVIYQFLEVADWRGGSYTNAISKEGASPRLFPFNQIYVQNIQVPTEYQYGSRLKVNAAVTASETLMPVETMLIGVDTDTALFIIEEEGSIFMRYDSTCAKSTIEIRGKGHTYCIKVYKDLWIASVDIDSSKMVAPLSGAFDINIASGATLTVDQMYKVLPGCTVTVESGGTLNIGTNGALYLYDVTDFPSDTSGNYNYRKWPSTSASKSGVISGSMATDGKLVVNGTLNVNGALYVSAGENSDKSCLQTSEATGIINFNNVATDTTNVEITTADSSGQKTISFTSAYGKLAGYEGVAQFQQATYYSNGTGWYQRKLSSSFVDCKGNGLSGGTVAVVGGMNGFICNGGAITVSSPSNYKLYEATATDISFAQNDNTFTLNGVTTGENSTDSLTVQLAHHGVTVDAAVDPDCDDTGLTEGSHCQLCGEVHVAQTTVAALGHTKVTDAAVAPTCTATGLTAGEHCSVCNAILTPQEEVKALGHTEVTDAAVPATCTTAGKTEGCHCSVCNAVIAAQKTVDALGHAWAWGDWASDHTCSSVCGNDSDHTITVTLEYRLGSYLWMNAKVDLSDTLDQSKFAVVSGGTYAGGYVIEKVIATEITAVNDIVLSYDGVELDALSTGLEMYQSMISDAEDYKLISAMLIYGEAAEDKLKNNANTQSLTEYIAVLVEAKVDLSGIVADGKMITTGTVNNNFLYHKDVGTIEGKGMVPSLYAATFGLDNCISLVIDVEIDKDIAWDDVVQIGFLRDVDGTTTDPLYTQNSVDGNATAYIYYQKEDTENNEMGSAGATDNHPNFGDTTDKPLTYYTDYTQFVDTLATDAEGNYIVSISHDLLYSEYGTVYTYRPYVRFSDGTVAYGQQIDYSVESYLARMMNKSETDDDTFLWATWHYIQAAKAWTP